MTLPRLLKTAKEERRDNRVSKSGDLIFKILKEASSKKA